MLMIMILYYLITAYIVGMLIWNFIREKKSVDDMLLYLIVLIPLVLRLFRIKQKMVQTATPPWISRNDKPVGLMNQAPTEYG